jgi:hypothetical protein
MYVKASTSQREPGRHSRPAGLHSHSRQPSLHTRPVGMAEVRKASLTALMMLVAQYGLGIILNLYVNIPASDHDAGIMHEIASASWGLTIHVLLGIALITASIALVARAVAVGYRSITVLAIVNLVAILGAFAAGELFVRDGSNGASLAMALLTGAALLCTVGTLALSTRGSAASAQDSSAVEYGSVWEYDDPATEYASESEYDPASDYDPESGYGQTSGYGTSSDYAPAPPMPSQRSPRHPSPWPSPQTPTLPRRIPAGPRQPWASVPQSPEPRWPGQALPVRGRPEQERPEQGLLEQEIQERPEQGLLEQGLLEPGPRRAPRPRRQSVPRPRRSAAPPYRDDY